MPETMPGPGRTLAIARCGECPFFPALYQDKPPERCEAGQFLPGAPYSRKLAWEWIDPGPPPDWCPLRAGPVTLEVRPLKAEG